MWLLLEATYRNWAPYYALGLFVAVTFAGAVGAVREHHPSFTVLIALAGTLVLWWAIGATRRALERREGREALFFKVPVPARSIAVWRILEGSLPLILVIPVAVLVLAVIGGGEGSWITPWHLTALGCVVLVFDQATLWLEEIQYLYFERGRAWISRAVALSTGLTSGVLGGLVGLNSARAEKTGQWFDPYRDVDPLVTLAAAGLAVGLGLWTYRVFLRREHPGAKGNY